jgi:hypothetical protein
MRRRCGRPRCSRKSPTQKQLEITDLPGSQIPGGPFAGIPLQLRGSFSRGNQINKLATVRARQTVQRSLGAVFFSCSHFFYLYLCPF